MTGLPYKPGFRHPGVESRRVSGGIINLTPHPIAIYRRRTLAEGPEEIIPPSGTVVRLAPLSSARTSRGTADVAMNR